MDQWTDGAAPVATGYIPPRFRCPEASRTSWPCAWLISFSILQRLLNTCSQIFCSSGKIQSLPEQNLQISVRSIGNLFEALPVWTPKSTTKVSLGLIFYSTIFIVSCSMENSLHNKINMILFWLVVLRRSRSLQARVKAERKWTALTPAVPAEWYKKKCIREEWSDLSHVITHSSPYTQHRLPNQAEISFFTIPTLHPVCMVRTNTEDYISLLHLYIFSPWTFSRSNISSLTPRFKQLS